MKYIAITLAILAMQGAFYQINATSTWIAPETPPPTLIYNQNGDIL